MIAATLVAADLALRLVVDDLSAEARNIAAAPARAARIAGAGDQMTMLILGDSRSREGIDAALLPGVAVHQPADSSSMRDWVYELENLFIERGAVPAWVILPVGEPRSFTRVIEATEDFYASFLEWRDLGGYFRAAGMTDVFKQATVVWSRVSALYNYRGRVQKRILATMSPDILELRANLRRRDRPVNHSISTVWRDRFQALVTKHGIRVAVVALPTKGLKGRLTDEDRATATALGWVVIEPAAAGGFGPEDAPDGDHLTPAARRRFTLMLAPLLEEATRP